jgi:hypothetical protein
MPLITGVDHNRRLVSVVAIGPVTLDDIRGHLQREQRENALGYVEMVDARGAGLPRTLAEHQQIAEMLRALSGLGPLGRTAILVSSDAELETVGALESAVRDICEVKGFLIEVDARAWLDSASATTAAK